MISVEVKTGKHTMDYDINGSIKAIIEVLEKAKIEDGNFILFLMDKKKGSLFRKGVRLIQRKKNMFNGTIQTGDNSSCFNFNLLVPGEINSAHLFSAIRQMQKKKQKEQGPEKTNIPVPIASVAVKKKVKVFDAMAFINDEASMTLLFIAIQEALSGKAIKVGETRKLMLKHGFISEKVSSQAISRFYFAASRREFFKKVKLDVSHGLRYLLTDKSLALIKKGNASGAAVPAENPQSGENDERRFFDQLYERLDSCKKEEEEISKELQERKDEIITLEAKLAEKAKEKERLKKELKRVIDSK